VKLDPARISFRPMTREDVPRLRSWLAAPHVAKWFTPEHGDWIVATVTGEQVLAHPFIALHDETPIAFLIWERLIDFPDVAELYGVNDPHTINCDVFIGDPTSIHRGLGPPMIQRFLSRIHAENPELARCVIDPVVDNKAAIRAYEKAGFRWVRNAPDGEGEEVYLMELTLA